MRTRKNSVFGDFSRSSSLFNVRRNHIAFDYIALIRQILKILKNDIYFKTEEIKNAEHRKMES